LLEQTGEFTIQGRGFPANAIFELGAERVEALNAAGMTGGRADQGRGQAGFTQAANR
jgi:hypothetical protein